MIDVSALQETILAHVSDKPNEFQRGQAHRMASSLALMLETGADSAKVRAFLHVSYPSVANLSEMTKQVMIHRHKR